MLIAKGLKFRHFSYARVRSKNVPESSGIYIIYKKALNKNDIVYIGSTNNFLKRMMSHNILGRLFTILTEQEYLFVAFCEIKKKYITEIEKELISKYSPIYNVWVSGKLVKTDELLNLRKIVIQKYGKRTKEYLNYKGK